MLNERVFSRNPEHYREDLSASLSAALGPDVSGEDVLSAASIVAAIKTRGDERDALISVLALGKEVFGQVLLFHADAQTSLMGPAEVLTDRRSLTGLGLTIADLGWPADVLHPVYLDSAAPNPEREARMNAAVEAWKAAH